MHSNNEVIHNAYAVGTAIPAFNIPFLPMMEPIVKAVVDQDAYAFIAVARPDWMKGQAGSPAAVAAEFEKWGVPRHVSLHVDHVPVIDEDNRPVDYVTVIREALAVGYPSVMVDGSRLGLEDNIRASKRVADIAHAAGAACEAELGMVLGHEAGPLPPYEELFASGRGFTDVDEARRFAHETGCDWLSVAIGNVHGPLSVALKDKKKVAARLNLAHLEKLKEATGVPLVLHGGSGVVRDYVVAAMKRGIAKINIATEVRQAYEAGVKAGGIERGQQAVYEHVTYLLRDHLELSGMRGQVAPWSDDQEATT
jgi:fructose-bisphosphate aldolase class II